MPKSGGTLYQRIKYDDIVKENIMSITPGVDRYITKDILILNANNIKCLGYAYESYSEEEKIYIERLSFSSFQPSELRFIFI